MAPDDIDYGTPFSLNYARIEEETSATRAALPGYPESDPDYLVGRFFNTLTVAVRRHESPPSEFAGVFFDRKILVGSDWREYLLQPMGSAEVLVPLYSVPHVTEFWPAREWDCLNRRTDLAGLPDPGLWFVSVLWTPLKKVQKASGFRKTMAHGPGEPDYLANRLRALLKSRPYHHSYQVVLSVLAKRVAVLTEESPVELSLVPLIDKMDSAFMPESHLAIFAIETAAQTIQWRPFPHQEIPLAEYAKQVAERFDFKAEVSGVKTVREQGHPRPGLILIDPWFIADDRGKHTLQSAIDKLPRWVLPLLILNRPTDARTRDLARRVRDMLGDAKVLPTDWSRRAARGVSSLEEFVLIVPGLVAEAERQYLRHRSGPISSPALNKRPNLGRAQRPDEPTSVPNGSQEVPDV